MPKKTKKEKLLARYHKKLRLLENRQVITSPIPTIAPITIPAPAISQEIKPEISEPINQYFFSDLKKSLLLIVLVIGIEVGLYAAKLIK